MSAVFSQKSQFEDVDDLGYAHSMLTSCLWSSIDEAVRCDEFDMKSTPMHSIILVFVRMPLILAFVVNPDKGTSNIFVLSFLSSILLMFAFSSMIHFTSVSASKSNA